MAAVLVEKQTSMLFSSDPLIGAESVSADGSSFSTTLDIPFSVPASAMSCQVGVIQSSVWNTSPNCSAAFGNNLLSYTTTTAPAGAFVITVDDGLYSLDALGSFIAVKLQNNGHSPDLITLSPNNATQQVAMTLSTAGDFVQVGAANSVCQLLGWPTGSPNVVAPINNYTEFSILAASLNRVNSYIITSDLVNTGVMINGAARGVLCSIPIDVGPGRQINFAPNQVQFFDGQDLVGRPRQNLKFALLDQDLRPTPTSGDYWSVTLLIKWYVLLSSMSVPLRAV